MIIFVAHKYYLVLCKTFRFDIKKAKIERPKLQMCSFPYSKNTLKNGLFTLGIFILMVGSYEFSLSSIPSIYAQMIPSAIQTNENITTNSGSGTTNTHTFMYIISNITRDRDEISVIIGGLFVLF